MPDVPLTAETGSVRRQNFAAPCQPEYLTGLGALGERMPILVNTENLLNSEEISCWISPHHTSRNNRCRMASRHPGNIHTVISFRQRVERLHRPRPQPLAFCAGIAATRHCQPGNAVPQQRIFAKAITAGAIMPDNSSGKPAEPNCIRAVATC